LWSAEAKLPPTLKLTLQHSKNTARGSPLSHGVGEELGMRAIKERLFPTQRTQVLYPCQPAGGQFMNFGARLVSASQNDFNMQMGADTQVCPYRGAVL